MDRNIKEDPGEGDELMTEDSPSGKGMFSDAVLSNISTQLHNLDLDQTSPDVLRHLDSLLAISPMELTRHRDVRIQDRRSGNKDRPVC